MKVINDSIVVKFICYITNGMKKILKGSTIVNFFTTINDDNIDKYVKGSVIHNIVKKMLNSFRSLLLKFKLDKYLKDSVFTNTLFWLCLIVFGIPIFPTIVLAGLSLVAFFSLILKYCISDNFKFKKITINYLIIAFIICIVFSTMFCNMNFSLFAIMGLNIILILNYFTIINTLNNIEDIKKVLNYFLFVGSLVSMYGIYQYFFGGTIVELSWLDTAMFEDISGRVVSTFNNPNVLGEYLIVFAIISFAVFINEKNKNKKILYGITFFLSVVCLIFTYSRGCWMGFIVAFLLMLLIMDKRLILVCAILGLFALLVMPDSIIDRVASIGNLADGSTSYRVNIWLATFDMLKNFWFSGIGYGISNFKYAYNYYAYMAIDTQHPHNLFLTILCGLGIIGLIIFVLIMILYFKRLISYYVKYRNIKNNNVRYLSVVLLSIITSMIGILIQGLFDNIWYNYAIILLFFVMIGLGVAITFILNKEGLNEKNK